MEGWIKGGGYINFQQNKEMTIKFMKKIASLNGFLKQVSFSQNVSNNLFIENWSISIENSESSSEEMKKE